MYTAHKKLISLLLSLVLVLAMLPSVFAAEPVVSVSTSKLSVNDTAINVFASYVIDGHNYLKVGDVAYLLKDTPAKFNPTFSNGVIDLKTGTAYAGTPSATKPTDTKAFAGTAASKFTLNGKAFNVKAYRFEVKPNFYETYLQLADFEQLGVIATFANSTVTLRTVPSEKTTLTIHAAASLNKVFPLIYDDFHAKYPNVTVDFNFLGSGALVTQIKEGAPGDIFVSADNANMDKLAEEIITDTRKDLLRNSLVLVVGKDNPKGITSFEDLLDKAGKDDVIAIGEAKAVPAGARAREVYDYLKLAEKLDALTLTLDDSVTKVLSHVSSGDAIAGFVYKTDALSDENVKVVATADKAWHAAIVYPAAVLKESENSDAAKAFIDYLSTAPAIAHLEAAGFVLA
ncbi:MAG: molybdate ABC transporter substrate-binding protein [Oscillospiraceae bacterium]|jgi:molybdate transport system substrate-binding protein|nr:molybdate ABC transporter substrate-binding protein [Oscillospiraceae bacterium]